MSTNSKKYKYLAKNIGLLTLSSFATKLLSFFLVPLYTNILTTKEYGINDLFFTTIGILVPIVTLNIQDAVMRFSLDSKYDSNKVLSVGIRYLVIGSIIVIIGLVLNNFFVIFKFQQLFKSYGLFFFLMFFSQALSGIITGYIRGIDKIKDLSIASVINSVIIITTNILFLVVFKWGLIGYFWANIVGPFVQCIYLLIRVENKNIKQFFLNDALLSKEMKAYSIPLIINAVSWWINNASDKYIVIFFLGLAANGVYSVAAKIPSILNILQSIFAQAWTLSAVKDYDPDDKNGFFAKTYAIYNCVMVIACSLLILLDIPLAKILYAKDFFTAWRYVPWLTIAIVFGSLVGYLGGILTVVKDSKLFAKSTIWGAVINIVLNFIFTPLVGVIGAAIATTISYSIVWVLRIFHSRRYIKIKINLFRDSITYFILVIQAVILLFDLGLIKYGIELLLFFLIVFLYINDIRMVSDKIIGIIKERLGKRKERSV